MDEDEVDERFATAFGSALALTKKLVSSMGVGKVGGSRRGPFLGSLKRGVDFALQDAPSQVTNCLN